VKSIMEDRMRRVLDSFLNLNNLDRVFILGALHELVDDDAKIESWISGRRKFTRISFTFWEPKPRKRARSRRD
jgi:hypothetical protein